jgi:hypothetical protein
MGTHIPCFFSNFFFVFFYSNEKMMGTHIPTSLVIVGGVFFSKTVPEDQGRSGDGKNDLARMHGIEEFLESTRSSRRSPWLRCRFAGWGWGMKLGVSQDFEKLRDHPKGILFGYPLVN